MSSPRCIEFLDIVYLYKFKLPASVLSSMCVEENSGRYIGYCAQLEKIFVSDLIFTQLQTKFGLKTLYLVINIVVFVQLNINLIKLLLDKFFTYVSNLHSLVEM